MTGTATFDTLEHSTEGSIDMRYPITTAARAIYVMDSTNASLVGTLELNVSSASDDGTGLRTVTFTNAFANRARHTHVSCNPNGTTTNVSGGYDVSEISTTQTRTTSEESNGSRADRQHSLIVLGELA